MKKRRKKKRRKNNNNIFYEIIIPIIPRPWLYKDFWLIILLYFLVPGTGTTKSLPSSITTTIKYYRNTTNYLFY